MRAPQFFHIGSGHQVANRPLASPFTPQISFMWEGISSLQTIVRFRYGPSVCSPSWLTRPKAILHLAYDGFLLPSSLIQGHPGTSGICYGAKLRIAPTGLPPASSAARFAARKLSERTGGPPVEVVRADFSEQIARKRSVVQTKWVAEGVPDRIVQAALDVLHPTGNPFLDLCLWKGRFPSRRAQFCTEALKASPVYEQVFVPAMQAGHVVSWQGERRAESPNRAHLPKYRRVRYDMPGDLHIWRPVLDWSAADTFDLHRHFGLDPNPLYKMGMSRVGCFPCINARKSDLAAIFHRFPEVLEKMRHYEQLVSCASKRQQATFYAASTTPQGKRLADAQKTGARLDERFPDIDDIAIWSKTSRGGAQFDGLLLMESETLCSSQYGLCE